MKSTTRALSVLFAGLVIGVFASAVRPSQAHAQGGVLGSIVGNVFDQAGMPMQGVKLVAQSATHIGQKVAYSAEDGSFRMVALQPGTFELTASAPKMNSIHQKGIKVGVNAPAEVNVIMEVQTAQETVKVIEKAPIVSTKSAQVKEVWDEEFIDNLPLQTRTSLEDMVNAAPGASGDSGARISRIRGGNQNQNITLVDGFNLTGLKTVYKSLAAMEVSTGGYGADGAIAPGGLVSGVTKSGSNRFEFDINGFHEDSRLRLFQEEGDKVPNDLRSYINPNLSGPIIKDKVWFYINGEARNEIYSSGPDPSGNFLNELPDQHYWNYRGTLKLTWQINPRNKVQSFSFLDENWSRNRNRSYAAEVDAQQKRERMGLFTGLTWESLLTDELFFKVQAGVSKTGEALAPQQCLTNPNCRDPDLAPVLQFHPPSGQNVSLVNNTADSLQDMTALELVGTLEWFKNLGALGDHDVKLTSRFYSRSTYDYVSTPGSKLIEKNGNDVTATTYYYSNDPRVDGVERYGYTILGTSGSRLTATLQDTAKVSRYFTVTPGVAMTTSSSSNSQSAENVTDGVSFTPHLAVAWDATHDGRTVVRASYNHYVDPDVGRVSKHNLGGRVSQRCPAGATGQSCTWSGGRSSATVGSSCSPLGFDEQGNDCRTTLKTPRTFEYTFGAEREVVEGLGVGVDFVYRDYTNQYSTKETNRIWNQSGSELVRTGAFRNGRNQTVINLETPESALRTYRGVTFAAHKREGGLKITASYTWAKQEGNIWDTEVNAWGDIPPRDIYLWGPTPDDSRHNIRATLVYRLTPWLSTGALYNYSSGMPYNRWFRNVETGGFDDLRSRVGTNPGNNINDPDDDRDTRLPDIQKLDVQLRANLKQVIGQDLELYSDILNILGLRTPTSYNQNDGPAYGQVLDRMGVTTVRLGFRYRY